MLSTWPQEIIQLRTVQCIVSVSLLVKKYQIPNCLNWLFKLFFFLLTKINHFYLSISSWMHYYYFFSFCRICLFIQNSSLFHSQPHPAYIAVFISLQSSQEFNSSCSLSYCFRIHFGILLKTYDIFFTQR